MQRWHKCVNLWNCPINYCGHLQWGIVVLLLRRQGKAKVVKVGDVTVFPLAALDFCGYGSGLSVDSLPLLGSLQPQGCLFLLPLYLLY
jgi:hypothetical protein